MPKLSPLLVIALRNLTLASELIGNAHETLRHEPGIDSKHLAFVESAREWTAFARFQLAKSLDEPDPEASPQQQN